MILEKKLLRSGSHLGNDYRLTPEITQTSQGPQKDLKSLSFVTRVEVVKASLDLTGKILILIKED